MSGSVGRRPKGNPPFPKELEAMGSIGPKKLVRGALWQLSGRVQKEGSRVMGLSGTPPALSSSLFCCGRGCRNTCQFILFGAGF